jgi:catechol 2,3-dioxygenase-like lactoylglutathione lyase family enzyme
LAERGAERSYTVITGWNRYPGFDEVPLRLRLLHVSDLERSIRFYRDVLGFKFVSRDMIARFDIDGVLFEVVPARDKSVPHRAGNARLCLRVDNVEEARKELQAQGVHTDKAESKGPASWVPLKTLTETKSARGNTFRGSRRGYLCPGTFTVGVSKSSANYQTSWVDS